MKVERVLLKDYTTLGVGGPAELWTVETREELGQATEAPYRVLGNGSNLLVLDEGVPERVIRLAGEFQEWDLKGWVGAGALLPLLVQEAARAGLSGLEGLLGKVDAARKGQPKKKSAGCAFKNPPGHSAGRLIDQRGLKGLRVEHGNFIVNLGRATAKDVLELLKRIQEELPLELEWEVWP
jgi:UDP-N-acetylenolpyruvoylglucosamine reductase